MMRIILSFVLVLMSSMTRAQNDTISNSFERHYKKANPGIHYSYDDVRQIHNYSNNWDFDSDGKMDQVYFVGTGGAHLYFFLRIILSSDSIRRDYHFLESDFPALPGDEVLKAPDFNPAAGFTQFAVFDYKKDNVNDIFLRLDDSSFLSDKKNLRKHGITSNYVMISFKGKKA